MAKTPRSQTHQGTLDPKRDEDLIVGVKEAEDIYFWGGFAAAGLERDINEKCSPGDYIVVNSIPESITSSGHR